MSWARHKSGELLCLALVSRLLEKIVSVAVKGPSSGGESHLVKQVMGFFPDDCFVSLTAMEEKALLYTERDLRHKMLVLMEAAGLSGDFQEYVIRVLLSEGFLEYEVTERAQDGLKNVVVRKEGPTGFITTTTRDKLHAENETRYLSITVTDTREQTRRIFRALAEEGAEEPDKARWHALQTWLEGGEHRVAIPYAGALAEKTDDVAVRLRRDFSVVLSLIKAHTILHRATRERDEEGRIIATLADYARVRELVSGLIAEGVEATVPKTVRETVEAVDNVIDGWGEDHATNKAVAEELEIDKAAASRRVRTAIGRGYLKNLEDRKGHPARLVLAESMPEDQEILPTVEELEGFDRLTVDSGGIYHPPSPHSGQKQGRGVLYSSRNSINGSTPARGGVLLSALSLYDDLKARGVILEAKGEHLKVDAPAGVVTEEVKRVLLEFKPVLLEFLSRLREEPQRAPERESVVRWAGPGRVKIRDPFAGEWHEWPAAQCLPGVVAEADRRRKRDRWK